MAKLKAFAAVLLSGLATISVNTNTDYSKNIPNSPEEITQAAWENTGNALRHAYGNFSES